MIVLVMGVSGCGKSTLGSLLAEALQAEFLDADDFHPAANVAKMAAGEALTDADRVPWLESLNARLRAAQSRRHPLVLACSALKQDYRDRLARGIDGLRIVHLHASREVIASRITERQHRYMPASLLESQFAILEPPEDAIVIDVGESPARCLARMRTAIAAYSTR